MGALHEGHLSLIRAARAAHDVVVVSLFVNPTQFNESSDLAAYPRDEARDAELARSEPGPTCSSPPAPTEIYPDGFATQIRIRGALTETLEGAHRGPGHFDGVATVVTKLLTIVAPRRPPTSAPRTRSSCASCAGSSATSTFPSRSSPARRCATPTASRCRAATRASTPTERQRALGLSRALREVADGIERGRFAGPARQRRPACAVLGEHGAERRVLRARRSRLDGARRRARAASCCSSPRPASAPCA